jgi:hypothetical protein
MDGHMSRSIFCLQAAQKDLRGEAREESILRLAQAAYAQTDERKEPLEYWVLNAQHYSIIPLPPGG